MEEHEAFNATAAAYMTESSILAETTENPPATTDINSTLTTTEAVPTTVVETPYYLNFRDEAWVIPLVSFSLFNIAAILIFEVYVLYKSCGSKRHLFLGQILLLGLFSCSVLGLFYVPEPHHIFCSITRAGLGIAYTIVFGTLLVKCIFLLKLHDGIYFNASFQALFLFFVIGVEVVIVTQWMIYKPSDIVSCTGVEGLATACARTPLEKIEYLSYVMLLLLLVAVGAIRARSLEENNREALYIGISIGISLVLWVAWISVELVFDRRYEAPAEAFGLLCTSLTVFLLIFVPKALQLANPVQDFGPTSLGGHSALHSAPSFLHLQPQAVLPNNGQGTMIKQSQVNADYCRGYGSRFWRYDYPTFHQMEPSALAPSDINSLKKLTSASFHPSHLY